METNWEKIIFVTKKLGGIEALAEKINTPSSTVRNWYNRKNIPIEAIPDVIIGLDYQITVDDIRPDYFNKIREATSGYDVIKPQKSIPLIKIEDFNYKDRTLNIDSDDIKNIPIDEYLAPHLSKNAFAIYMSNGVMEPNIYQDDIIIIDPDCNAQPGDIIVVRMEKSEIYLVGKYKLDGFDEKGGAEYTLIPSNNFFPSVTINSDNRATIIGPIIEHRRILHKYKN